MAMLEDRAGFGYYDFGFADIRSFPAGRICSSSSPALIQLILTGKSARPNGKISGQMKMLWKKSNFG
jgi:hypothetical protein